ARRLPPVFGSRCFLWWPWFLRVLGRSTVAFLRYPDDERESLRTLRREEKSVQAVGYGFTRRREPYSCRSVASRRGVCSYGVPAVYKSVNVDGERFFRRSSGPTSATRIRIRSRSISDASLLQSKLTISTQFDPLPVGYLFRNLSAPVAWS